MASLPDLRIPSGSDVSQSTLMVRRAIRVFGAHGALGGRDVVVAHLPLLHPYKACYDMMHLTTGGN